MSPVKKDALVKKRELLRTMLAGQTGGDEP